MKKRCEKDVVRKTSRERRREKDVPSTDSNLISFVFQFSTAVKVAEDLISFTDLLVIVILRSFMIKHRNFAVVYCKVIMITCLFSGYVDTTAKGQTITLLSKISLCAHW